MPTPGARTDRYGAEVGLGDRQWPPGGDLQELVQPALQTFRGAVTPLPRPSPARAPLTSSTSSAPLLGPHHLGLPIPSALTSSGPRPSLARGPHPSALTPHQLGPPPRPSPPRVPLASGPHQLREGAHGRAHRPAPCPRPPQLGVLRPRAAGIPEPLGGWPAGDRAPSLAPHLPQGPERPGEQGRWPRQGGGTAGHRRRATGDPHRRKSDL
jgi:hypothetical protein